MIYNDDEGGGDELLATDKGGLDFATNNCYEKPECTHCLEKLWQGFAALSLTLL